MDPADVAAELWTFKSLKHVRSGRRRLAGSCDMHGGVNSANSFPIFV